MEKSWPNTVPFVVTKVAVLQQRLRTDCGWPLVPQLADDRDCIFSLCESSVLKLLHKSGQPEEDLRHLNAPLCVHCISG